MPPAATLRDTEIPLPHDPATAGRKAAPETAAPLCAAPLFAERLCTALRSLLWLVTYVAIMRLLGYRIRRPAAGPKSAAPTRPVPPASTPAPVPPPAPRQKHRYLDRDMCLNMLANISSAFAPAQPAIPPTSLMLPAVAAPPRSTPPCRAPAPPPFRPPPRQAQCAPATSRAAVSRPRAHKQPPPFQNPAVDRMQTRVLFVAIS